MQTGSLFAFKKVNYSLIIKGDTNIKNSDKILLFSYFVQRKNLRKKIENGELSVLGERNLKIVLITVTNSYPLNSSFKQSIKVDIVH